MCQPGAAPATVIELNRSPCVRPDAEPLRDLRKAFGIAGRRYGRRSPLVSPETGLLQTVSACGRHAKGRKKVKLSLLIPVAILASGLVAGEGLAGVLVAGLVAAGLAPKAMDPRLGGLPGELLALLLAGGFCLFLYRGGRAGRQGRGLAQE